MYGDINGGLFVLGGSEKMADCAAHTAREVRQKATHGTIGRLGSENKSLGLLEQEFGGVGLSISRHGRRIERHKSMHFYVCFMCYLFLSHWPLYAVCS